GWDWSSFGAGVLRVSYSFFVGALTYRLWDKMQRPIRIPPAIIVGALIAILSAHPPIEFECAYDLLITILVFPAIVLIGASSKPSGYNARACLALGLASYGVYVMQDPVREAVVRALAKVPSFSSMLVTPAGGIGFVAILFVFALV